MENKATDITLEKLASMINEGFNNNNANFDANIEKLNSRIDSLESAVAEVKSDTEHIRAELNKRVEKVDFNTLTYRVEKLEEKLA